MNLIYWNTKNLAPFEVICNLISEKQPDFLFLSEIKTINFSDLNTELQNLNYQFVENPGCTRIKILKRNGVNYNLNIQNSYYTALFIPDLDIYIISLHLPSQMYNSLDSIRNFIRQMKSKIDEEIGNSVNEKIVIIGDFNVNPFESPMINLDGFGASNSKISRHKISSYDYEQFTYYNPTWKLYANDIFPGTKYFRRPSATTYDIIEHHFLDQVILSRKLSNKLISEEINVIYNTSIYKFYNTKNNSILISDHLPLQYKFEL